MTLMTHTELLISLIPSINETGLIRIGRKKDGGYVIPIDILRHVTHIISAGIYLDASFESDLSYRCLIPSNAVILIDKSIRFDIYLASFLREFFSLNLLTNFKKAIKYSVVFLLFPLLRQSLVYSFLVGTSSMPGVDQITLQEALGWLIRQKNFASGQPSCFLKIDIEGSEYELLEDIISLSGNFCCIAMELHDISSKVLELQYFLRSMYNNGFVCAHCHQNTRSPIDSQSNLPTCIEITLVRDELVSIEYKTLVSDPFQLTHSSLLKAVFRNVSGLDYDN